MQAYDSGGGSHRLGLGAARFLRALGALSFFTALLWSCQGEPESDADPAPPSPTDPDADTPVQPAAGPDGFGLAIGLNSVSPTHYGGWSGPLGGCEPDARDMQKIAADAGLQTKLLLTAAATRQAVKNEIAAAAARLESGDLFVLSYSGHGGQMPDANGDDPDDGLDETWCLFDGELLDDELYAALCAIKSGVRVLVFSDSCHSGTVVRMRREDFDQSAVERRSLLNASWRDMPRPRAMTLPDRSAVDLEQVVPRAMPPDVALETYFQNKDFYDGLGRAVPRDVRDNVKCHTLLISGCEDDQLSSDIGTNGLFTLHVRRTWNAGAFTGSHPGFHQAVRTAVLSSNPSQAPAFFTVGTPIAGFPEQKPYTVSAP